MEIVCAKRTLHHVFVFIHNSLSAVAEVTSEVLVVPVIIIFFFLDCILERYTRHSEFFGGAITLKSTSQANLENLMIFMAF